MKSRRRTKIVIAAIPLFCGAIHACSGNTNGGDAPRNEGIAVAQAGNAVVTQEELDEYMQSLPAHVRERMKFQDGEKYALEAVIDRRLLSEEARARGVDELPAVKRHIEDLLIRELVERETNRRFTEEQAQALYDENSERFVKRELHLRHILFRLRATDGQDAEKLAEKRAKSALSKLQQGASFEELAQSQSEDQVSAARGGDLGWVRPESLPPELREKALGLSVGELSPLIQSEMGFHLLRLEESVRNQRKALDEVRPVLKTIFQSRVRSELIVELRKNTKISVKETR